MNVYEGAPRAEEANEFGYFWVSYKGVWRLSRWSLAQHGQKPKSLHLFADRDNSATVIPCAIVKKWAHCEGPLESPDE